MQWRPSDAAPNCQPPASLDGSRGGRGGPPLHELMRTRRCSASATGEALLKHVNVLARAHFFEHLWPNRNAHLAQMRLLEQGHVSSRLTDASTDAQRQLLVPSLCDRVPNQNVAVESVHFSSIFGSSFGDPVVVVRGSQLVRIAVFQRPADPVDEHRRVFLKDRRLSLLSRKLRVSIEDVLRVNEGQLLWEIRISVVFQSREKRLHVLLGSGNHLPDLLHCLCKVIEIAFLRRHYSFPIPLIDISAVIVIQKVVLAHRAHVGAQAFAFAHAELLERYSFPFRRRLHNLSVYRMLVIIV